MKLKASWCSKLKREAWLKKAVLAALVVTASTTIIPTFTANADESMEQYKKRIATDVARQASSTINLNSGAFIDENLGDQFNVLVGSQGDDLQLSYVNGRFDTVVGPSNYVGFKRKTMIIDSEVSDDGVRKIHGPDFDPKGDTYYQFSKGEILKNVVFEKNVLLGKDYIEGLDENGRPIRYNVGEKIKYIKLTEDRKLFLSGNLKDSLFNINSYFFDKNEIRKAYNDTMTAGKKVEGATVVGYASGIEGNADYATAIGAYSRVTEGSQGSIALGSYSVADGTKVVGYYDKQERELKRLANGKFYLKDDVHVDADGKTWVVNDASVQEVNPSEVTQLMGVVAVGGERTLLNADGTTPTIKVKRRLQGIAPGKDDDDAVTITQIKNLINNGNKTVIYTDKDGNPVKKATDGKYYPEANVDINGQLVNNSDGSEPTSVETAEVILSVVNPDGTTKPNQDPASGGTTAKTVIRNVADPVADTDAANKHYVDSSLAGVGTLNFTGDNDSAGTVDLKSQKFAVKGTADYVVTKADAQGLTIDLDQKVKDTLGKVGTGKVEKGDMNTPTGGAVADAIKTSTDGVTTKGLDFAANSGNDIHRDLGTKLGIKGEGTKADDQYSGQNIKTMTDAEGNILVKLDKQLQLDSLTVGKNGADGKPGEGAVVINGKDGISVIGKDGKDAVSIKGKDGVGHIGLTGPAGTNGKDGATVDISVKPGYDDEAKGINGAKGVDGKDGITRIVYEDANGEHQIATMEDGLKFAGDRGEASNMKLNSVVSFKGGATPNATLTNGNIGVVSDGKGNMSVQLNQDLTGMKTIAGQGTTLTLGSDGLDVGGKKVTGVATPTAGTDAANKDYVDNAVNDLSGVIGNGKDGRDGKDGAAGMGQYGPTGKDGLNGKDLTEKTNALRNGEAGTVVYTNEAGARLVKGADGQYYLADDVEKDGKVKANAKPVSKDNMRLSLVDSEGNTTGANIKLANVADGAITSNSKDAINGSQLHRVVSDVATYLGGNAGVNDEGKLTQPTYSITGKKGADGKVVYESTDYHNVGDALAALDGVNNAQNEKITEISNTVESNSKLKFNTDSKQSLAHKLTDELNFNGDTNIAVTATDADHIKVGLKEDIAVKTVTVKDKATVGDKIALDGKTGNITADSITTKNLTADSAKVGNIAINGNNGTETANTITGLSNTTWDPTKIVNGRAATEDQVKAIDDKINSTKGDIINEVTEKGLDFIANSGEKIHRNLGQALGIKGEGTKADDQYSGENIKTMTDANGNVLVKMDKQLSIESLTVGPKGDDGKPGEGAVVINGKDGKDGISVIGKDGKDAVSIKGKDGVGHIGLTGAPGKDGKDSTADISVKPGAPGLDGKDGETMTRIVYKDQDNKEHTVATHDDGLKFAADKGAVSNMKLNSTVSIKGGAIGELSEANLGVVSDGQGNLSVQLAKDVKGLNSIETNTLIANTVKTGNTTVSDKGLVIKDGPSVTSEGINVGGKRISGLADGVNPDDAVNMKQLGQIGQDMSSSFNKLDTRIKSVGAHSAALAALHPTDFDPDDKWAFAAGYGNYRGANAAAIGAYYHPNEDTLISVGSSIGSGENMINAGVSLKLGQGNHVSTSRVAMAKELKDLRKELENMKNVIVSVSEGEKLTSLDMDNMKIFPDIPENHWAYDYIATLAGNGVIEGYPDGYFNGNRMMTRYEMAAIIYRAIQNGVSIDSKMTRALKEFEPELARIRIDTISKKSDGTPDIQRVRVIPGRG